MCCLTILISLSSKSKFSFSFEIYLSSSGKSGLIFIALNKTGSKKKLRSMKVDPKTAFDDHKNHPLDLAIMHIVSANEELVKTGKLVFTDYNLKYEASGERIYELLFENYHRLNRSLLEKARAEAGFMASLSRGASYLGSFFKKSS